MWKSMMMGACCALLTGTAVAAPAADCAGHAPTSDPVPAALFARCAAPGTQARAPSAV